jgi:serine/threonine protein kinase
MQLNVLIDKYKVPKLCDFGLTRISLEGGGGSENSSGGNGTMRYQAPELLDLEVICHPTKNSDMFALGCLSLRVRVFLYLVLRRKHCLNCSSSSPSGEIHTRSTMARIES